MHLHLQIVKQYSYRLYNNALTIEVVWQCSYTYWLCDYVYTMKHKCTYSCAQTVKLSVMEVLTVNKHHKCKVSEIINTP